MNKTERKRLKSLANNATKGNWVAVGTWVENDRCDLPDICDCRFGDEGIGTADAEYIAAIQPKNLKELLKYIDTLEKLIDVELLGARK